MAKKKKPVDDDNSIIIINEQNITDTLEINYMPYAMSVIVSRAIPEIDGFKPSHRKLLYTMYEMGLLNKDRTKSSNVVGQTMKLNPHGDAAIYETMVRLTEGNMSLNVPFVDSKGNFGKQYSRDMAYAASRYTEVKLAPVCNEIFADIDKNTVDFIDNFDATTKEPVLLPTTFPNILVNANKGIAVGMASDICGFNLKEVCDATVAYIKDPKTDISEIMPAPDFPGGGEILYNKEEIEQIYRTGKGSIKVRARYSYDKANSCIDIYEIPYSTNIESIIDKVIAVVKSGKIKDITDIRDETDKNGLKITIDIKRSADPGSVMQKLYALTPLCDSYPCNFNILINGRPRTMGVYEILDEWISFRKDSIMRMVAFDIKKKSDKLHLLEGLSKILLDIDKAISIIRHTEEEKMVVPNLMSGFKIDEIQAVYIAEIKLRNINKEYILNRLKELETLKKDIADLKETLKSEAKIKKIIVSQLNNVSKKYGYERRSPIIYDEAPVKISKEDLVEDYAVKLFLTEGNYFKKIPVISLVRANEHKLKEDDRICHEEEASNKDELLFFSNKFNVYKMKVNDIADTKASLMGDFLNNILDMEADERIVYFTVAGDYKGHMIFGFENGKMARITLSSYQTKVNRKKLINAYSSKSPLVFVAKASEDIDVVLLRDYDKATLLNTSLIPENTTKASNGVQVFTLKRNSIISSGYLKDEFKAVNVEYYRTKKIPSTGHFIKEDDKALNEIPMQLILPK
ncbi:MAG: topoisomerase IV [Lachnospiraceae bacterium]|nr:topoisomerase IV [Lachnospiraceae bacterium]